MIYGRHRGRVSTSSFYRGLERVGDLYPKGLNRLLSCSVDQLKLEVYSLLIKKSYSYMVRYRPCVNIIFNKQQMDFTIKSTRRT